MSTQPAGKEQWATKIGVILAVSGSAVGLGNFLRFPGKAATYGGGAFMIPYFVSLLLIGIPICWVEWTLGRQGGRSGYHSSPGIMHLLLKNRVGQMFGTLGLLIPVAIYMYYVYIEAWCLGYAWQYLTGAMSDVEDYAAHFDTFVGAAENGLHHPAANFLIIAFVTNFILIYRGLTKGIEAFCKIAMPTLIVAAVIVLVRVLTLPPQPVAEPWHMSLPAVMPTEKWSALCSRLHGLASKASALAAEVPDEEDSESHAEALAGARGALSREVTKAVRSAKQAARGGESEGTVLEGPAGWLGSYDALRVAAGMLQSPETHAAYAEWLRTSRQALDDETKWELIRLEGAEAGLAAKLASEDAGARAKAEAKRAVYRAMRNRLLDGAASLPAVAEDLDGFTLPRLAAAEVAALERSVVNGLGFMWNPKPSEPGGTAFGALSEPQVWLEAAGQIFFSISVGFGIIITYASYLRRNDDVALSGLTATSTNEFCEVCLGGLITVPAAFIFLGATPLAVVPGTFGLGFVTLPDVFEAMPAGRFFGFLWFAMLFAAAITSSLSMLQPAIAFLEEGFGLKRKGSVALLGLITAIGCLMVVYFSEGLKALDTMDFWIGSFCVFVMATVLVIVFGWVVGVDRGLALADEGAELRIPRFFGFVLKYVSPLYLLTIFAFWLYNTAPGYVQAVLDDEIKRLIVVFLIIVAIFFGVLVSLAIKRWNAAAPEEGST